MVDSLNTYHPFLTQIPYTHAHTHPPGACLSPPQPAPPQRPPVVESNCVCMCVCACMCVQASQASRVHDQIDQALWASWASRRDAHKSGGNTQSTQPKYVVTYQHSFCKKRVTPPGTHVRCACLPGSARIPPLFPNVLPNCPTSLYLNLPFLVKFKPFYKI